MMVSMAVFALAVCLLFGKSCYGSSCPPTRTWPLTDTTYGFDTQRKEDSIAKLHGCAFNPSQESTHPYPSLNLDGASFVDIPLTEASIGESGKKPIKDFSMMAFIYLTDSNTNGVLFEYRDDSGKLYFQVTIEHLRPKIKAINLGIDQNKCSIPGVAVSASDKLSVNTWHHLTIIRSKDKGEMDMYLGDNNVLDGSIMDCQDNVIIGLPGWLRVGASYNCSGHLIGRVSCVRLYPYKISTAQMDGHGCNPKHPLSFSNEDLNSTCQRVTTPDCKPPPNITATPTEFLKRYYQLRQRDADVQNDGALLEDIVINGRLHCSSHCQRHPTFQCGAYCLRLDNCLAFTIRPLIMSQAAGPFTCSLYNTQQTELFNSTGSRYYEVKTKPL